MSACRQKRPETLGLHFRDMRLCDRLKRESNFDLLADAYKLSLTCKQDRVHPESDTTIDFRIGAITLKNV
jgi:hypothetical protein